MTVDERIDFARNELQALLEDVLDGIEQAQATLDGLEGRRRQIAGALTALGGIDRPAVHFEPVDGDVPTVGVTAAPLPPMEEWLGWSKADVEAFRAIGGKFEVIGRPATVDVEPGDSCDLLFECSTCEFITASRQRIASHVRTEHGRPLRDDERDGRGVDGEDGAA